MYETLENSDYQIPERETPRETMSASECDYINECVEGRNPSALIDRIDELTHSIPPKAIDSNAVVAEIIEPMKDFIDSKYLEAPTDVEQIGRISDCLDEYDELRYDNWVKLSMQDRFDLLQELESQIAMIEHREPCPIILETMEEGCYGAYSMSDKTITFNALYVEANDFDSYKDTLDTLIHEGRHAYQDYNMTEREVHPHEEEVNLWKWNEFEIGYQNALYHGFKAYAMQPVESDARAFAEDVLTSYLNKSI